MAFVSAANFTRIIRTFFTCDGEQKVVSYEPAESQTRLFGGNSNWRGPVWMPINYLLIESLQKFHHYYGDDFKVECPTGSGQIHHFETKSRTNFRIGLSASGCATKMASGLYPRASASSFDEKRDRDRYLVP